MLSKLRNGEEMSELANRGREGGQRPVGAVDNEGKHGEQAWEVSGRMCGTVPDSACGQTTPTTWGGKRYPGNEGHQIRPEAQTQGPQVVSQKSQNILL